MSNASFRIKQDKAEFYKQMVIVTNVAVRTTKFPFGMCDCTLDSNVGMVDILLVLRNLHICGHTHVRSHVSPGTD